MGKNTPGIANATDGHTYLILTARPEPPSVAAGWTVEAARISSNFELDQRGDRSVRLLRILNTVETDRGPVRECEFQIDRG